MQFITSFALFCVLATVHTHFALARSADLRLKLAKLHLDPANDVQKNEISDGSYELPHRKQVELISRYMSYMTTTAAPTASEDVADDEVSARVQSMVATMVGFMSGIMRSMFI